MHRFVLIGLSGSGKTTQVELRYGLNSGANMDDPPGTGPSAEEMLRWIRGCSRDLVNMSVHHRGILELARMAQEMPEQLGDMTFIYLEAREEVLRNRLRGRNDESCMPSPRGLIELEASFSVIADETIDVSSLTAAGVKARIEGIIANSSAGV